jgi:toxin ParE1/3/4
MIRHDVLVRPQAIRDLLELAEHIAADNLAAAERLLDAFERSVELLRTVPTMGSVCRVRTGRVKGLRVVAIRGFPRYLVLYRFDDPRLEVLRVIHGARDLGPIIDETP